MKKYNKKIMILIFFIGIFCLMYPKIGNIINNEKQKKVLYNYKNTINIINKDKLNNIYEEAVIYNEKIYNLQKEDKKYNLDIIYENMLKVDDNAIIGYINIPKLNRKIPIYHGVSDSVLQNGVGHVKETSLPIGTNNQNSMLLGHSGLATNEIFTDLEKIENDDIFIISVLDKLFYYKVIDIEIITPDKLKDKIYVEDGLTLVTLVTCTPYAINTHRLVVKAELIKKEDNI